MTGSFSSAAKLCDFQSSGPFNYSGTNWRHVLLESYLGGSQSLINLRGCASAIDKDWSFAVFNSDLKIREYKIVPSFPRRFRVGKRDIVVAENLPGINNRGMIKTQYWK